MISVALVLALCVVFVVRWLLRPKLYNTPPMLPGKLPFIGHAHLFLGDPVYIAKLLANVFQYTLEKGGVIQVRMGPHPLYIVTDTEDGLKVANTCIDKPYLYDFAREMLGNGLFTAHGPSWKKGRKLLNPSFNQQVLYSFLVVFNEQTRCLVSQLSEKVGKGPFTVRRNLIQFTMRTLNRTLLGLKADDEAMIDTEYAHALEEILDIYVKRGLKIWLHLSFLYNFTSLKSKQDKLQKMMNDTLDKFIEKRKSELEHNKRMQSDIPPGTVCIGDKYTRSSDNEWAMARFKPVMDQLLNLADTEGGLTNKDIREHLDSFILAAFDTTATALEYTLLMIGSHDHVQERMYKEIQEVFGGEERDVEKNDLAKLVYVEAVIRESLRLYPPGMFVGRKIDRDVKLKSYTLPAGGTCFIGLYGMNRHPVWGADANEFKPERWLNPETLPADLNAFSTFSIGKRNCIGITYSYMMMKTTLALLLQRFHVTSDISDMEFDWKILSKPVSGNLITLSLRNEIKT